MAEVDVDALQTSRKVLYILVIVLNFVSNFLLQWRLGRQGRFMKSTRKWLIQTLSWGDNVLCWWVLLQSVRIAFEPEKVTNGDFSCESRILANIYATYFLTYVHAISIITLCGELNGRASLRKACSNPYIAALLVAALPWISALILILPLTLADLDHTSDGPFGSCLYTPSLERQKVFHIIGIVVPCGIALVFSFFTLRKPVCHSLSEYYDDDSCKDTGGMSMATTPAQHPYAPSPDSYQASQPPAAGEPLADVKNEQRAILVQAGLLMFLTYPWAMINLNVFLKEDGGNMDPVAETVVRELFTYMILLRSVVTPAVWIFFDKTPPACRR